MLENFVIVIHLLAALATVGLILLQHGKGADVGASFGSGSSQTVFGVQGSGNLLTHATAVCVTIFFLTSLSLAFIAKQKTTVHADDVILENVAQHAADEVPATPAPDAAKTAPVAEVAKEAAVTPVSSDVTAPANAAPASEPAAPASTAPKGDDIPQ